MSRSVFPLISTIIPVYNVEEYLPETIDSVIAQTIGFRENIEIVLVNDGSRDDSLQVCLRYQAMYPNNIVVIDQKNAGVSAARNNGIQKASGKYIHLLDSDDVISKGAYVAATTMLEENDGIDFVALKIEFFDGQLGGHPLNYKFTGDRVVSIDDEPDALIIHMATCIMRRSAVKHRFDSKIQISEDMKFLSELLIHRHKYGLISSEVYYYRKRRDSGSAIDGATKNITYYTITPKAVYKKILSAWRGHAYAQHVVMYDLQWRLRQQKQTVLNERQEQEYRDVIKSLIKSIDDSIILAQKNMSRAHIEFALRQKHNGKLTNSLKEQIQNKDTANAVEVAIHFIHVHDNIATIEFELLNSVNFTQVTVSCGDSIYVPMKKENVHTHRKFIDEAFLTNNFYTVTIPLTAASARITFTEESGRLLRIIPKRFSRLQDFRNGYAVYGRYIIANGADALVVSPLTLVRHILYELRLDARIMVSLKIAASLKRLYLFYSATKKDSIKPIEVAKPALTPFYMIAKNILTVLYRICYYIGKVARINKKPVWIISDLPTAAGDNGEALFRYIKQTKKHDAIYYFALSKKSVDYSRLRSEFGRSVIHNRGFLYKVRFLLAEKIISAHADEGVVNPFLDRVKYLNDLYTFSFIFLQHGVIHNDISGWLNRYNKNIKLFVVSAQQEYDSILEYPYYYEEKNILPSGLPRYDRLNNDIKKKLILAPTWRHHLAISIDYKTGSRPYNPEFITTEYFNFYNSFMKSKRLRKALLKNNMTAELYLHPAFQAQADDFDGDELFSVKKFPYSYKDAFSEGSLLITDYSSVIFDFIYLNKPIIYAQFDKDAFFKQHMYTEGYLDDERDGFGPVTKTLHETIDETIKLIDSDCIMQDMYKKRIDTFFLHRDAHNSMRVYDAIIGLDEA